MVLLKYVAEDLRKEILKNPEASRYKYYQLNGVLTNMAQIQETIDKFDEFLATIEERIQRYLKNVELIENAL